MKKKISVLGPLNMDILTIGQGPENWKENLQWEAKAEISLSVAGSVGYTVQDFALLGNDVSVIANIGDDDMGHIIKRKLDRICVKTDLIQVVENKKTAIGVYWLMHGDRKRPLAYMMADFLPWPNGFSLKTEKRILDCELLHCGGYLHYSAMHFGATTGLYKKAKERGITTSIDTQFPLENIKKPWINSLKDILPYTDILIADIDEARAITGYEDVIDCIGILMDTGIKVLAVKQGAKGSYVVGEGGIHFQEAITFGGLVDSIGAGDAYGAAFLTRYIQGNDIKECAKFASAVAGITLTGMGGTSKMPTYQEALKLIKKEKS